MTDEEKAEEYVARIQHDINNWGGELPTERFYNEIKLKQAYLDGLAEGRKESAELKARIEKMACKNKYLVSDDNSNAVPCYTFYDCKHCSRR